MKVAKLPHNEKARLKLLHDLNILDTELDRMYDELTELAAKICETPISLISLVDENRQWFKSRHGLDATETPRDYAFCAHAILGDDLFVVPDSSKDERFSDNPLVTGEPRVHFYAGYPLEVSNNLKVGTLCVIDHKPRNLTEEQRQALKVLGNQVKMQLKLRKSLDDLRKAEQQASEANLLKSSFLANMSHEIRTPMHAVLGYAEMLKEGNLNSEQKEQVENIEIAGRNMMDILNDILDFSKIESGMMDVEITGFDLRQLIDELNSLFSISAKKKGIRLKFLVDTQLKYIESDSTRLKQILSNLISNAIKFTSIGSVSVSVELEANKINFTVSDTGDGIAKDRQDRIFDSFTQAESSTTRKYGGTGLGLTISKQLTELLDGEISVESELGKGAQFKFTIPFKKAEKIIELHKDYRNMEIDFEGVSILLVEDNELNIQLGMTRLAKLGAGVTLAKNGKEAVDLVRDHQFDLIIMDCQMPVLDGYVATEQIRQLPNGRSVPIIAMTAGTSTEEKSRCFEVGMDAYLSKPLSLNRMKDCFDQFLKKAS